MFFIESIKKSYTGIVLKYPWHWKVSLTNKFFHKVGNLITHMIGHLGLILQQFKQQFIFMGPLKLINNGPFENWKSSKELKEIHGFEIWLLELTLKIVCAIRCSVFLKIKCIIFSCFKEYDYCSNNSNTTK